MQATSLSRREKSIAWVLFLSAFCGHVPPMMLPAIAQTVARDVGVTVSDIGVTVGAMTFASGLAGAVAGLLLQGRDRRLATALVLAACAAATACIGFAFSPLTFYTASALAGACFGLTFFLALSAVPDYFAEAQRPPVAGRITSAVFLASLLGVPLALAVAFTPPLSWRASYFIVAGLCVLACIAVLRLLPRGRAVGGGLGLAGALSKGGAAGIPLRAVSFLGFTLLTRLGVGMYMTYIPAYLVERRAFPESGFILTFAMAGALAFFATNTAGRVLARGRQPAYAAAATLVISAMVLAIVYFPATAATILWLVLAFSLVYSGAESFRMTALNLLALSQADERMRTIFLGLYSLCMYWGYALGAVAGGLIMRAFGDAQVAQGIPAVMWTAVAAWMCSVPLVLGSRRPPAPAIA